MLWALSSLHTFEKARWQALERNCLKKQRSCDKKDSLEGSALAFETWQGSGPSKPCV